MALEDLTGTKYINSLVSTNPTSTDNKSEGDDHIRGLKNVILQTFPNVTGAVTATHTELNALDGLTASVAELNILDGVTASTAELNILDGVTSTAAELNILDGVTSTAAEINLLDGVTGPLKGVFKGALVYLSGDQAIASSATPSAITWDSESYDTASIHSTVTNTSRLTVPTGATKARLAAYILWTDVSTTGTHLANIYKNGVGALFFPVDDYADEAAPSRFHKLVTPIVSVVAGDYFEVFAEQTTGVSASINSAASWFAMEIIE